MVQPERRLRSLAGYQRRARRRWTTMQLTVLRLLGHAVLASSAVAAVVANDADQEARAQGLLWVHAEPSALIFGQHACLQPAEEEIPPEPEPPPCPRTR